MSNNPSRNIPEPIKREVRQRCGFGCVICGLPIYDYDHLKQWAIVKEHVADDITLLCPSHHREVTSGRLPRDMVLEANKAPYNFKHGRSTPTILYYQGDSCDFIIGNNKFSMDERSRHKQLIAFMVDGIPILSFNFDQGHLLLNAVLFDERNFPILNIFNNQLVYALDQWDIKLTGKKLIIRSGLRKVFLEITFETPNIVIINSGRLLCNGVEIKVDKGWVIVGNSQELLIGSAYRNFHCCYNIGYDPHKLSSAIRTPHVNRYK